MLQHKAIQTIQTYFFNGWTMQATFVKTLDQIKFNFSCQRVINDCCANNPSVAIFVQGLVNNLSNEQLPFGTWTTIMVKQFLDTLWPVFGFARLLGMFPCKRISNEDGNIVLKPINGKLQWLIYCCTEALILFSALSATSWHFFKSQRSFEEVQKCQYNLWGGESIVDLLTFLAALALISLGSIMVQYGAFIMRHWLCGRSFQLDRNLKEDPLLLTFLTVSGLFVPPVICNSLLTGWLMVECLNLNWIDVVPTLILSFLQIMNGYVPLIVFFALTLECFSCLAYEIQQVRQHVEDRKLNITILDSVANMTKKLEDVRLLLSNNLFWIMVIGSIEILVMLYLVPAYFINYSKSTGHLGNYLQFVLQ